ncbi:unnamed protein product, partial [Chrysoparadoxa australica]
MHAVVVEGPEEVAACVAFLSSAFSLSPLSEPSGEECAYLEGVTAGVPTTVLVLGGSTADALALPATSHLCLEVHDLPASIAQARAGGGKVVDVKEEKGLAVLDAPGGLKLTLCYLANLKQSLAQVLRQPSPSPPTEPEAVRSAFPTIELLEISGDRPVRGYPNSTNFIPLKSAYFEGEVCLLLKTDPLTFVNKQTFEGKKRIFEVQTQGRFLKEPQGEVYIGLEITKKMQLGLVTRGLCKLLLSFGQKLNKQIHYSFGDDDNTELPHISWPLTNAVDVLVITPDGQEPPTLGKPLHEDAAAKKERKSGGSVKFEVGPVYSFSFHSAYISFEEWKTCQIPVMRDMDLSTFWGDSALRMGAYVVPHASGSHLHRQADMAYMMLLKVTNTQFTQGTGEGSDEGELPEAAAANALSYPLLTDSIGNSRLSIAATPEPESDEEDYFSAAGYEAEENGEEEEEDEDEEEQPRKLPLSIRTQRWLPQYKGSEIGADTAQRLALGYNGAAEAARCPGWIDLWEKRGTIPGIPVMPGAIPGAPITSRRWTAYIVVRGEAISLRQTKHLKRLPREAAPKPAALGPRLSDRERSRRCFDAALLLASTGRSGAKGERVLNTFMNQASLADKAWRKRPRCSSSQRTSGLKRAASTSNLKCPVLCEGMVIRCLSERHFSEEWGVVNTQGLLLLRHKKTTLQLPREEMLCCVIGRQSVLPGYTALELHTVGRVHYLLLKEEKAAKHWQVQLERVYGGSNSGESSRQSSPGGSVVEKVSTSVYEQFLQQKTTWRPRSRFILNCRRMNLTGEQQQQQQGQQPQEPASACDTVAALLDQALALQEAGMAQPLLIQFLDATTKLRLVSMDGMSRAEQLCTFLNLYHLMIVHSFMVLGPPSSPLRWASYFTTLSYEVGDDIISLAELEHCVLRHSPPRQFLSKFVLPTSQYSFGLETPAPRNTESLICGRRASPRG